MNHHPLARRDFLCALAATGAGLAAPAFAQEPAALKEPVFRVAKGNNGGSPANAVAHPLDPAIKMAHDSLANMQKNVTDYTATIVSRERVNGVLGNMEFMAAKIRNQKVEGDRIVTPLSVYMKFLKPKAVAGREVLWIEGQNNNKMFCNPSDEDGRWIPSVWLRPDGPVAMRGRLHPITDIGIENLITKLIERGNRERQHQECEVRFIEGAKINGRVCTVLEVEHPVQRSHFEFNFAQIFIDDEYQIPIRYAAYLWPGSSDKPNPNPNLVIEEYTYLDVKLNQGLTNEDFDPKNPNYNF